MLPLITNSRKFYRRFYRLVACAVVLMNAVLTGSLLLGDSVRGTLVQRVDERLAGTETIITSGTGFMSETFTRHPLMRHAEGFLLTDGFVSVGQTLLPVNVWGTDADSLPPGEVLINEPLSAKLAAASRAPLSPHQALVLHLPALNIVPSGSLFVNKSYANQMRVQVAGIKGIAEGGNLLLKNEQARPLNVFVSREYLSEVLDLKGKINLVLAKDIITQEQLAECWTPDVSGIHISDSSLTCDGVFLPQAMVEKLTPSRPHTNTASTAYFSYFVNELSSLSTPLNSLCYSFVTAVTGWGGQPLVGHDIILSDYAAARLQVSEGDSVSMEYFVARHLKNLDTRRKSFRVRRIEPLSAFMRDSLLLADFPGLTRVERCTDWDSDLPIDMSRVTKADEDFWHAYRQTPKAVVAYDAVSADWANAFGSATAIRFATPPAARLVPGDADIRVVHPRSQAIEAAKEGVDFAGLFLALGFFIILSAILLMQNPLAEMFSVRQAEIRLYQQLGFSDKAIARRLFREAFGVILLASPAGILAGLLYAGITLWLLGSVWSGATQTEGFALHIHPSTLLVGWLAALLICAFVLWRVISLSPDPSPKGRGEASPQAPKGMGAQPQKSFPLGEDLGEASKGGFRRGFPPSLWGRGRGRGYFLFTLLSLLNFVWFHSMAVFVVCGLLWVLTWGMFLRLIVERQSSAAARSALSRRRLSWLSVGASFRQHNLAYWTLSLGIFTVFAVGLNRPDLSRAVQQSGGYDYYVDSRVPIQYDLNNQAVRRKLSLQSLPDSTFILGFLRHSQDEASCLNLNMVTTPTVLGVDLNEMAPFGLKQQPLLNPPLKGRTSAAVPPFPLGEGSGERLLGEGSGERPLEERLFPPCIFLDQESLLWSLKKSVGDTLIYQNDHGQPVPVVIAGSYPTGIFHGNAIMSITDFRRLWPRESGVEVLLLKSSRPDEAVAILSTALSQYGLNVQSVAERISMFFEVTETYLVIFLALGGLGMLLGIFSLVIIVRKNLTAQSAAIRQLRSMGFSDRSIGRMLLRENLLVPLYALAVGATGAVISISANIGGAGCSTFLMAAFVLAALCLALFLGIKSIISQFLRGLSPDPSPKGRGEASPQAPQEKGRTSAAVPPSPKGRGRGRGCFFLFLFPLFSSHNSCVAQPVTFRGENHCGIFAAEKNLLKEWPAQGPRKLWVADDAGKGNSSALVSRGRIYTAGLTDDELGEQLTCYKLDGTKEWQVTYGHAWRKAYCETRSSPVIDADRIYMVSNTGELVCLNRADGKVLWALDYWNKYDISPNDQGICEHPLIDADKVIITTCGREICMAAFNKFTGEVLWETKGFGDKATYCPSRIIEWKGHRQVIGATEAHVFGVDPETGKMIWSDDQWTPKPEDKKWLNAMINSPVFYRGRLLVSLGDTHGCTLYQMADDLSAVKLLWKNPELDFYMGGMIEVGGVVYGSTGDKHKWAAVDLESGKVLYHQPWAGGKGRGALIMADGMFYMFDERRGTMGLARINPEKLDLVSEFRITDGSGACFAHPSIYDGVLYVRHGSALIAYDIRKQPLPQRP